MYYISMGIWGKVLTLQMHGRGGGSKLKCWHCWHQRKMGLKANNILKYLKLTLFLNHELTRISKNSSSCGELALVAYKNFRFTHILTPSPHHQYPHHHPKFQHVLPPQCKNVCPPPCSRKKCLSPPSVWKYLPPLFIKKKNFIDFPNFDQLK